jgi:hypothetical protein
MILVALSSNDGCKINISTLRMMKTEIKIQLKEAFEKQINEWRMIENNNSTLFNEENNKVPTSNATLLVNEGALNFKGAS